MACSGRLALGASGTHERVHLIAGALEFDDVAQECGRCQGLASVGDRSGSGIDAATFLEPVSGEVYLDEDVVVLAAEEGQSLLHRARSPVAHDHLSGGCAEPHGAVGIDASEARGVGAPDGGSGRARSGARGPLERSGARSSRRGSGDGGARDDGGLHRGRLDDRDALGAGQDGGGCLDGLDHGRGRDRGRGFARFEHAEGRCGSILDDLDGHLLGHRILAPRESRCALRHRPS